MKWEYITTPLLLHRETAILNNWGEGLDRAQEGKRTLGKDDVQK